MNMPIDELVKDLEIWINGENLIQGEVEKIGLTIHYSPFMNKWVIGYGRATGKKAEKSPNFYGIGDTIEEAIQDKINKDK